MVAGTLAQHLQQTIELKRESERETDREREREEVEEKEGKVRKGKEAKEKGLSKKATDAYVYGTLRKMGWKPKPKKKKK